MKLQDIKVGSFFVFEADRGNPYLRVMPVYCRSSETSFVELGFPRSLEFSTFEGLSVKEVTLKYDDGVTERIYTGEK